VLAALTNSVLVPGGGFLENNRNIPVRNVKTGEIYLHRSPCPLLYF